MNWQLSLCQVIDFENGYAIKKASYDGCHRKDTKKTEVVNF